MPRDPDASGAVAPAVPHAAAVGSHAMLAPTPAPTRRGGLAGSQSVLVLGMVLILLLGGLGFYATWQQRESAIGVDARAGDEAYSFYHDRYFDNDSYSAQFERSGIVHGAEKWSYDGPYQYGSYGSKGMADRATKHTTDRVMNGTATESVPDVWDLFGDTDPSGGDAVGGAWMAYNDPTYNPYAGYANPYANRIKLTWGPGIGRGALDQR
jgi:hypothetical protein